MRHPGGEDELEPWDVVFFPPGPNGAHQLRRDTDSTAGVLTLSTMRAVAPSPIDDGDKISIWTTNGAESSSAL